MSKISLRILLILLVTCGLAAQSITVTSPAGGPRWCRGQVQEISWTSSGLTARGVGIYLRQGGRSILDISANNPLNGSFSWRIPATLAPGNYFIQVGAIGQRVSGASELFSIADCGGAPPPPPAAGNGVIKVVAPALKEVLAAGSQYAITWKSKGIDGQLLNIKFFNSNMVLEKMIATGVANGGSYPWPVPNKIADGEYFIVVETQNGAVAGTSELFTIKSPNEIIVLPPIIDIGFRNRGPLGLDITNPSGCDILKMGTLYAIDWRLNCPSPSRLRLLLIQNNRLLISIAENVDACSRSFTWRVGRAANGASINLSGVDYRIVVQTPDGSDMGVSAHPFAIVDWTLEVQTPNGGETWPYGSVQAITWRTRGSAMAFNPAYPNLNHVRIDLFRPSGVFVGTIAYDAQDTGSLRWTVGDAVDHSRNRVGLADGPYIVLIYFGCGAGIIEDRSNAAFTISNCPR